MLVIDIIIHHQENVGHIIYIPPAAVYMCILDHGHLQVCQPRVKDNYILDDICKMQAGCVVIVSFFFYVHRNAYRQ